MPLIVMCGIPGSGKSTRSKEIEKYLTDHHKCRVCLINEESLKVVKQTAYASSQEEKIIRGKIKFEVERNLLEGTVVIIDSLNYIKGYRYQMYCVAREVKTTYCVVFCNTPLEKAKEFNALNQNKFSVGLQKLQELAMRMEVPQLKNRWDVPLLERRNQQSTPVEEIAQILLFEAKRSKDPVSTKQDEKLSQSYLYEANRICQQVCEDIVLGRLKSSNTWSAMQAKKVKNDFTGMLREKPIPLTAIREAFNCFILEADRRK